jgi:hypothetical protein
VYKVDRPGVARVDTFADRWAVSVAGGGLLVVLGVVITAFTAFSKRMFR